MKKLFLILILASTVQITFGQDYSYENENERPNRNEFGIDATAFIKQFLNFSSGQFPDYYYSTYYLTYRRHFSFGNIRSGIGFDYSDYDIPAAFVDDSNKYHYNSYSLNSRIGWEFTDNINTRWQIFYGMDFRPVLSYIKNDAQYWNGGYANGSESKSQTFGIAPILGFRFRLANRLSISTEASFSFNIRQTESRRFYIPVTNQYPAIPDDVTPKSKTFFTNFAQPLSLFITFDI